MKRTTIGGQPVFVLHHTPNWGKHVACSFSVLSDSERGLTGKEDRTPLSRSLRASMDYSMLLTGKDAVEFRSDLKDLKNTPVLCPFWPAQSLYSSNAKDGISAGLWVAWEQGWDTWELYLEGQTPDTFTPSSRALKAPLLRGRLSGDTSPEAITDEAQTCSISFVDNSPVQYALTVDEQVFKEGPEDIEMFPLLPNWAKTVDAGATNYELVADEVGFGRETADAFYDQDGARLIEQTSACVGWSSFKKMLRFFFDKQGDVGNFWVPLSVADCRLGAAYDSPPDLITVSGTGTDFDGDYAYVSGTRWEKGETHWIEKTGGQWEMSDGTTTLTAPDNGLNVPPDQFAGDVDIPQSIKVVGGGAGVYLFDRMDYGRPSYLAAGFGSVYYHPEGQWWISYGMGVVDNVVSTSLLPPKTGYTGGQTLEYDLTITATVSYSSPAELEVSPDHPFNEGDYLSLISAGSASGFSISNVEGNLLSLSEPLDRAYRPKTTTVSSLLLARFNKPSIDFSFITDELAVTDVSLIEVPKEYSETDSGAHSAIAYFYTFTLDKYNPWRFTSYEKDLTHAGLTYTAKAFSHSNIVESVNLDKNEIELNSRYFWHESSIPARNPLGYFLPFKLEATMGLEIQQATLNSSGSVLSAVTLFKGQVVSAKFDGPFISAKCAGISSLFDRRIPTVLLQPTCNYAVYSEPCGLLNDSWKMVASVVDYVVGSYEIIIGQPSFVAASPAPTRPSLTEVFEHYFAGGRFESGVNTTFESRGIMDSVAVATNMKLILRHPLDNPPLPTAVINLWPGCDGKVETCKLYHETYNLTGKFDNYSRFGGFPFVPIGNPTLSKVNKKHSQGGKK